MTWTTPERDAAQIDALVADRYLEALLAAADRRAGDVPADIALDPALRDAVRTLRRAFVRVHPSFRFEERLAARLAELAVTRATPVAQAGDGVLVPFPPAPADLVARDPGLQEILEGRLDPADPALAARAGAPLASVPRPVIVGGAVASAAISLAGVALVAWRAARPAPGPMARAARAARSRRLAAGLGAGRPA